MNSDSDRLSYIRRFYDVMTVLQERLGGMKSFESDGVPIEKKAKGVYFFFDTHQPRSDSGDGPRVVRIGTHGVSAGAKSTIRQRLRQHMGSTRSGGGGHRGSVFRHLVGLSLIERGAADPSIWSMKSPSKAERLKELPLEREVSVYIRSLSYLWVSAEDQASSTSDRAVIESNAIALLSDFGKPAIDPATDEWLGCVCPKPDIPGSSLWNSRDVRATFDPRGLELLVQRVGSMKPTP
jgi:hypothetical protein